jgi:hypothetical protein
MLRHQYLPLRLLFPHRPRHRARREGGGDPDRAGRNRQPAHRRRPDGDASSGAVDRRRGGGASRRASATHSDDAGPGEAGARPRRAVSTRTGDGSASSVCNGKGADAIGRRLQLTAALATARNAAAPVSICNLLISGTCANRAGPDVGTVYFLPLESATE